jgi:adenosylhomocysteinase
MKKILNNPELITQGKKNLELAEKNMSALMTLRARFKKAKTFKGVRIGMALHITKETGVLVRTFVDGGAEVAIASCNPLSTQDDVAAALAKEGVQVYGYKGETRREYYDYLKKVIASKPHITIDDGCDLVTEIHRRHKGLIRDMIGGCEETTTGILRLRAMEKDDALKYPIIAVNDNDTKHLMDNYYGTGQSTIDGLLRATNVLITGKTVVVAGYGDCGKGVAMRAKGLGANVIVTEVKPFRALQAEMDGHRVLPMADAAPLGDIFITVTGNRDVIRTEHMRKMKSGAIMANSGHFDIEIDAAGLKKISTKKVQVRPFMREYTLKGGKVLYLIAEGRLVNLSAAEGHPSEVMSMSFCGQALAVEYLLKKAGKLKAGVHMLPESLDEKIASLQLSAMDVKIDKLNAKQKEYLSSWQIGT